MANIIKFAECDGEPVEINAWLKSTGNAKHPSSWQGYCPNCGRIHVVTRIVEYKTNPSRHECDNRCLYATGRIMRCECKCGGRNHGRGHVLQPQLDTKVPA